MTTKVVHTSAGDVELTLADEGRGRPYLLLHGGGGPVTMARFASSLAASGEAQVISPVHPGFQGTSRPEGLATVRGLAEVYSSLLDDLDLSNVTVVGNSIGGWIAAELALRQNPRMSRAVLVDAGGLTLKAYPVADVFSLAPDQLAELSFRDPQKFLIDPSKLSDAQRAAAAANRSALRIYSGVSMGDPTLLDRLPSIRVPTLVIWGAADRVYPRQHGEAYARAIPGARFEIIPEAGHLPPLETPDRLTQMVTGFAASPKPSA